MSALSVWRFAAPAGAADAALALTALARRGVVSVDDAAVLTWAADRRAPRVRPLGGLTGPGTLCEDFWPMVHAVLFLAPAAGLALGAAAGAVAGALTDFGIDDAFIMAVRNRVVPGTSALFVLSGTAAVEPMRRCIGDHAAELLRADLSREEAARLGAALGAERASGGP
jgi:uncharacterized membrane protein